MNGEPSNTAAPLPTDERLTRCARCEGTGRLDPPWPVGPSGARLDSYPCSVCGGTGIRTQRDEVMNPPKAAASAFEARNLNASQRDGSGAEPADRSMGMEAQATQPSAAPIPMLLWCPGCGDRHIDAGEFATKVHHTHACQSCGMVWRPAIVPTVGVQWLPGFKNEQ